MEFFVSVSTSRLSGVMLHKMGVCKTFFVRLQEISLQNVKNKFGNCINTVDLFELMLSMSFPNHHVHTCMYTTLQPDESPLSMKTLMSFACVSTPMLGSTALQCRNTTRVI